MRRGKINLRLFISDIIMMTVVIVGAIVIKNINEDPHGVRHNGWLSVDSSNIVNEHNEVFQMRGISSHGIQWFGDLYNYENLKYLKEQWGINVFRVAMYTDSDIDGYVSHPELYERATQIIDDCVELDMYVIIDWHILNDSDPRIHQNEAREFFERISQQYQNTPNVIYEICNEPNGETKWEDVKQYANEIIPVIRNNSPKSLIVVGSPNWSRDLSSIALAPLDFSNIAYALHFYSGVDNQTLRTKIDNFREKGFAVFVTECGATNETGDGKLFADAFKRWTDYLDEKQISWLFWSFSNKEETSSIVQPDFENGQEIDLKLTETGQMLKTILKPADN